jgi:hypothetical protein
MYVPGQQTHTRAVGRSLMCLSKIQCNVRETKLTDDYFAFVLTYSIDPWNRGDVYLDFA